MRKVVCWSILSRGVCMISLGSIAVESDGQKKKLDGFKFSLQSCV